MFIDSSVSVSSLLVLGVVSLIILVCSVFISIIFSTSSVVRVGLLGLAVVSMILLVCSMFVSIVFSTSSVVWVVFLVSLFKLLRCFSAWSASSSVVSS